MNKLAIHIGVCVQPLSHAFILNDVITCSHILSDNQCNLCKVSNLDIDLKYGLNQSEQKATTKREVLYAPISADRIPWHQSFACR